MGLLLKLKDGDTSLKSLRYGQDRPGGGDSGQPFIKTKIPNESTPVRPLDIDGFIRGGLDAPKAAEEDAKRLSNYLFNFKNPSGLLFVAKQNVLSRTAPKTEASFGAAYGGSKKSLIQGSENNFIDKQGALVSSGKYRKGPAGVNEGIYTPLSTIGQARVGYLGTHLNKQGLDPSGVFPAASINKYQEVAFENNRTVNNAHKPDIPVTLLKKQERLIRKGDRLFNKSIRLENKEYKAGFQLQRATDSLSVLNNTPAKVHALKQRQVYFKPNFQSRQLQKLGVTGQMVANTNNPIPAGTYPIVPSGNPNNVQGITFSQQGPTGRFKNVGYNNFQKKKKQILDKMSEVWRNIQINLVESRQKGRNNKVNRLRLRQQNNDVRVENNFDAQDAIQNEINDIRNGPSVYENRLLKLWNKIGLEVGKEFPFTSPNLLSYGGGPGSALGIGKTSIKFSTLNDGVTPYRTGYNSRRFYNDYNGFFGNLDPKIITDQQYNWQQIIRNSATYQYLTLKDNQDNLIYNTKNYSFNDVFDPNKNYKWFDNFQIKETTNQEGFMPWAYDTPLLPTQSRIDQSYDAERVYEPLKFNIRKTGNAGRNEPKITINPVNPITGQKPLNHSTYKKENVKVRRENGQLTDLIEFTICIQAGDKIGNNSGKTYLTFPAFIEGISDNFGATYKNINYMGRPEPFYKYQGFKRDISFGFTVVAQSRAEIGPMYDKLNLLASTIAPSYTSEGYMTGNIAHLTIGDIYDNIPGIIDGFSFSVPEDISWDIGLYEDDDNVTQGDGAQTPMMIKVNGFKFTPLYNKVPSFKSSVWFGSDKIIDTTEFSQSMAFDEPINFSDPSSVTVSNLNINDTLDPSVMGTVEELEALKFVDRVFGDFGFNL